MVAPNQPLMAAILVLISSDLDYTNVKERSEPPPPAQPPQCGVIQKQSNTIQTRMIVGGSEASPGAWPWQIAVLDRNKRLICGGTLIDTEFVLTAAHCVTSSMHIVAGEYNLVEKEGYEQKRRVIRAFKHPQYNKTNVDNDIALLKLDRPLELSRRVWHACLPEAGAELEASQMATIVGWGAISYHRPPGREPQVERDDMLHQADVPVVDFDECQNSYGEHLKSYHVICAGYKEGRVDSCAGDSGGPLLVEVKNRWTVYGVTSFGDECGKEGKYGIYSKTSSYVDWINKVRKRHQTTRLSLGHPESSAQHRPT